MKYKKILITGGAGFVGSHLCLNLKKDYPKVEITALDNLYRKGSELNVPRITQKGIRFINGDVRKKQDIKSLEFDLLIECSAEPSVLAGVNSSPDYLIDTNLGGAINCFEAARQREAAVFFLSTSRVYPISELSGLNYSETQTKFELSKKQTIQGLSQKGISEYFPMGKTRSLYGATKLSAELILQEYIETYKMTGVINRYGVITGPWQMGKIDQGVIVLWIARHIFANKPLSYIGFGGLGKQVRDFIHIDDVYSAIKLQLMNMKIHNGHTYNIGGGLENSLSLLEMTKLCQNITGNSIKINKIAKNRVNDVPIYITDHSFFTKKTGWLPTKNAETIFQEIYQWIMDNREDLEPILNI